MPKFYFMRNNCSLKQVDIPRTNVMRKFREEHMTMTLFHVPEGGEVIVVRHDDLGILVDCGGGHGRLKMNTSLAEDLADHLSNKILITDMVASHNHHDHTNGFAPLLDQDIEKFLAEDVRFFHNGESMSNGVSTTLRPRLSSLDIDEEVVSFGDIRPLEWKDDQDILMFKAGGGRADYRSIVMNIPFNNATFLLVGDLQKGQEKNILKNPLVSSLLRTDVLKISHHGSSDSTTSEFLHRSIPGIFVSSSSHDDKHELEDDVKYRIRTHATNHGFEFHAEQTSIFNTLDDEGVDISVKTDGIWQTIEDYTGILFEVETTTAIHNVNHE